jgi:hypothetical protein
MSAIRPSAANVRSQRYYVARTNARCGRCGFSTIVLALALPKDHQTLDTDTHGDPEGGGEPGPDAWQRATMRAILFYVEYLSGEVRDRLSQLSPSFRLTYSPATLNSYWANHCEHCGKLLGDHELHCEPDGAFMPSSEAAAAEIRLLQIDTFFEAAAGGYALEPEFLDSMRRD